MPMAMPKPNQKAKCYRRVGGNSCLSVFDVYLAMMSFVIFFVFIFDYSL